MNGIVAVILAVFSFVGLLPTSSLLRPLAAHLVAPAVDTGFDYPVATTTTEVPIAINISQPSLGAASVYAVDIDSGALLYAKDPGSERPIASITKIVTALVILRDHNLNETVTVPNLPSYQPEDAKLGLVPGQKFVLSELLKAALIPSDNDAADALALYDSGTIPAFTAKMNQLAADWGISRVHFVSDNGLVDQDNYATAAAMARFAGIALHNPEFAKLTSTPAATITDANGHSYQLVTTNHLLGVDSRVSGIKTGFTAGAGQSLVVLATIKGHRIITVVLNSPDRFSETTTLINWTERTYQWQ